MKISSQQIEQIQRIYGAQQRRKPGAASAPDFRQVDKVELSTEGRLFETARKIVDATPEVRQHLVDRIKAERAAGTYNVDSRQIARQIVARIIADSVR